MTTADNRLDILAPCTMETHMKMRNGMKKWNEGMNGTNSALKDPNIITFKSRD